MEQHEPPASGPGRRQLHPLPRGLVELYGLLAVLFVLMPEWLAGRALGGFGDPNGGAELPVTSIAWQRLPELRLATLGLAGLRQLARQLRMPNYAALSRDQLTARLLARLRRQRRGPWTPPALVRAAAEEQPASNGPKASRTLW